MDIILWAEPHSIYTARHYKRLVKWGRILPCITTQIQDGNGPKLFSRYSFIASTIVSRKKVHSAETATEATKRSGRQYIMQAQHDKPAVLQRSGLQSSFADMKLSQISFCFITCSLATALAASIPATYDLTTSSNADANITAALNSPLNLTLPLELASANNSSP